MIKKARRLKINMRLFNLNGKIIMIFVASLLLLSYSEPAMAAEDYITSSGNKLFRGVANAVTGWLEFPKQIYTVSRDDDAFTGVTYGAAKGVANSVLRTVAGGFEIGTFFVPLPSDSEPLMDPEYVWDDIE